MRACFVFLCILTATFAVSVKTKPHGKHHGLHKTSHIAKEKDIITEESNKPQILPTLVPFEDSSLEQEDEELTSESNANANKEEEGFEVHERSGKSAAVLLSDEELADILKKEAEEEHEMEEALEEAEVETGKGKGHSGEIARDEEKPEMEEDEKEGVEEDERVMEETAEDAEMLDNEELEVEMMPLLKKGAKSDEKIANRRDQGALFEETDGSTDSEIPADLDYAADSGILQPLRSVSTTNHLATDTQGLPQTEVREQEARADDFEQDLQNTETVDYGKETSAHKQEHESNADIQELQENTELKLGSKVAGKEEEKGKNDSGSHSKGKVRKHKKNQRARKHFPQNEEPQSGQEQSLQESESGNTDNTATKAKRRRAGKWGPLVGLNPVQIRATVDLYPSSRSALAGGVHHPEVPADPCAHFPCKRGKMCKLDADDKPVCVCQEPSECPPSVNEFDQVCGTDNKTYDTSCELFATKCKQEGTKRGHRLHLDYTGPCKLIPPCMENELVQFPLRMRDWLKNVLLQLYEHDSMSPGFLTPKQRFRVKKIFESERRLHAGNHSVELLAQDFEKNYNMYIYPVHWQFAQLDQHPSDRFLSHSELAPLRVPLVPMEHCTSRFFQECDADKDKQVSFKEWTSCFGIKNEDMDVNQLF